MGVRMLYRGCDIALRPADANAGLWYDKFANAWLSCGALRVQPEPNTQRFEKLNWIQTVTGKTGDPALIRELTLRRALLLSRLGSQAIYLRTEGPFVTGLGRSHPVENGFAWHHLLGTAYLPGSSVKGMVRQWAALWADVAANDLLRIFGSTGDFRDQRRCRGSVQFWDALPVNPLMLEADVMTVHYDSYYQSQEVPGDWLSPTPIPFLVVAAEQPFQFAITAGNDSDSGQADCEIVRQWLIDALENVGAGAKTASGYGRFTLDTESADTMQSRLNAKCLADQQQAERTQQLETVANASEVAKELMQAIVDNDWTNNRDQFLAPGRLEAWIDRLTHDPQADAIGMLVDLVKKHLPAGLLDNPDATKGKNKPKFKDRQQKLGRAINQLLGK